MRTRKAEERWLGTAVGQDDVTPHFRVKVICGLALLLRRGKLFKSIPISAMLFL